jgi:putative FmdB family regulatory protein
MPIYEYRCLDCGHTFERLQSLQERPVADCPECGKPVEKVMSASVGYIMKGANNPGGGRWAQDGGACCGQSSPCEDPKRCCTK